MAVFISRLLDDVDVLDLEARRAAGGRRGRLVGMTAVGGQGRIGGRCGVHPHTFVGLSCARGHPGAALPSSRPVVHLELPEATPPRGRWTARRSPARPPREDARPTPPSRARQAPRGPCGRAGGARARRPTKPPCPRHVMPHVRAEPPRCHARHHRTADLRSYAHSEHGGSGHGSRACPWGPGRADHACREAENTITHAAPTPLPHGGSRPADVVRRARRHSFL
jgi:hypothetical protein